MYVLMYVCTYIHIHVYLAYGISLVFCVRVSVRVCSLSEVCRLCSAKVESVRRKSAMRWAWGVQVLCVRENLTVLWRQREMPSAHRALEIWKCLWSENVIYKLLKGEPQEERGPSNWVRCAKSKTSAIVYKCTTSKCFYIKLVPSLPKMLLDNWAINVWVCIASSRGVRRKTIIVLVHIFKTDLRLVKWEKLLHIICRYFLGTFS